ncbi:hypothetical protein EON67_01580 [archaeon]|nr:MAG: hypothetical protein EON67_01580 [archaeon]
MCVCAPCGMYCRSHASSRRRQVRGDLGSTPGQHTQAAAGRRAQPPNTPGTPSSVGRQHAGGAASVYDATSEVGSAGASVADEALIWGTTIILTQVRASHTCCTHA